MAKTREFEDWEGIGNSDHAIYVRNLGGEGYLLCVEKSHPYFRNYYDIVIRRRSSAVDFNQWPVVLRTPWAHHTAPLQATIQQAMDALENIVMEQLL